MLQGNHHSFNNSGLSTPSSLFTASTPSSIGLHLPDTFGSPATPFLLETVPLETLIAQNPQVQALFNRWQDATNQVVSLSKIVNSLFEENQRLRQPPPTGSSGFHYPAKRSVPFVLHSPHIISQLTIS